MDQPRNLSYDTAVGVPRRFIARRGYSVQIRSMKEVDSGFLQAWNDLENQAQYRNPFLSAAYVLPAASHLPGVTSPVIVTIERQNRIYGLGVFDDVRLSRRLPVRHLQSWQTPHTYLDGMMLRKGDPWPVMEEFWNFMVSGVHEWHGVDFPRAPIHDPLTSLLHATAHEMDVDCLEGTHWARACLNLQSLNSGDILQTLSTKRAKSLRRGWRELEKQGTPRYELTQAPEQLAACTEELMALENLGWKCDTGTSLISNEGHAHFFREMTQRMADRESLSFSRILLDDKAIASVVHLHAGDSVYAFKLGWDPQFERGCPGFHLKLGTASHVREELPGVNFIDSCSQPGSFIESVWPHRREFCSRTYATSPVGTLAATMVRGMRWVRKNAVAVSKGLFRHEHNKDSR